MFDVINFTTTYHIPHSHNTLFVLLTSFKWRLFWSVKDNGEDTFLTKKFLIKDFFFEAEKFLCPSHFPISFAPSLRSLEKSSLCLILLKPEKWCARVDFILPFYFFNAWFRREGGQLRDWGRRGWREAWTGPWPFTLNQNWIHIISTIGGVNFIDHSWDHINHWNHSKCNPQSPVKSLQVHRSSPQVRWYLLIDQLVKRH